MGFKCGIVGLPNVGKSTLFNALTQTAAAQAANYPFCTIEPNVGEVAVPEPRLDALAKVAGSKEIIPARMNFVDIAGLVEGASQGEGLGNKFLANIRETDAIIYVLRCFDNDDITHVRGKVDPVADFEVVETELMLADLDSLEKRKAGVIKKANSGDKEAKAQVSLIDLALAELNEGRPARKAKVPADDMKAWQMLQLLTSKPVLFVANVDEASAATGNAYSKLVEERAKVEGAGCVVFSAQIESELALLDGADRAEYLASLGLGEPGLTRLIQAGYQLLGPPDLLHRRPERGPRLDDPQGLVRAESRRRHPRRFRKGLHPGRNHSLRRLHRLRRRSRREGQRQDALRRQGIHRAGRRRDAVPFQRLTGPEPGLQDTP